MATAPKGTGAEDLGSARRALVVLGMHRSGTSAMARTLSLLGASLPKGLMAANDSNPSGHWEPQAIADLNDEILQALDSEWDDVFSFRPKQYLSNFDKFYLGRAVQALEEGFDDSELIVLKDPRVSVITSFWDRALREAGYKVHYIVMVRNPLEVAESLRSRDRFPREKSLLLWSSYMISLERDTRDDARMFVSYDQLMNDWRSVRGRLEQGTGVPFPRDTAAAALEIDRFLDRSLRHYARAPEELFTRPDLPDHVKTLSAIFFDACNGGEVDRQKLDAIQSELGKIESLVGPVVADLKARAKGLADEVAQLSDVHADAEILRQEIDQRDEHIKGLEAQLVDVEKAHGELAQRQIEQDGLRAEVESKLASWKALCEREQSRTAKLTAEKQQLSGELSELQSRTAKLATEKQQLSSELSALQSRLREKDIELEAARNDCSAVEAALELSRAQAEVANHGLRDRFREIATLTNFLADRERRLGQSEEEADWLRETASVLLNDSRTRKGRLLRYLPAAFLLKRQQRLLKRRGLFDADAYLAANADVAADRLDPLSHYLNHGMSENRRRR